MTSPGGDRRGFTLIELLIVVAIIGIIAAIAVPNVMNALNRAKQKRTMADMRAVALAIESYSTDTGYYPPVGGGTDAYTELKAGSNPVGASMAYIVPTYLRKPLDSDTWNYPIYVGYDLTHQEFGLMSRGRDGLIGIGGTATPDFGTTTDFRDDIVFLDGSFVKYPDGLQHLGPRAETRRRGKRRGPFGPRRGTAEG